MRMHQLRRTLAFLTLPVIQSHGAAPPPAQLTSGQPVWIGYAFMVLLVAVILAVSLMPSKRSHQD